jgi:predicted ATPase/class 3 adenylate cyclase/DNA-binding winged helix-turn-helix (wHTH) protein
MRYRLLGPLEVIGENGEAVALTGGRERVLLASLVLGGNQVVSTDRLVDALWGDDPPATAANALQVQVSKLRKKLSAAGADQSLSSAPQGYVIRTGPGEVDLEEFERLASKATGGDPADVSLRLHEALAIWRGPALADVSSDLLQGEKTRLEQLRLLTFERRIEADLALGRHAELVGELEALVQADPLREGSRRQLMLALYRSGRQADALATYKAAREVLAEELGIDPGPGLQALEMAILNQDPELAAPTNGAVFATATPVLPSGTLTLLMTDIEGSTRLWEEHPDAMSTALERHDALMRSAIESAGGYVFKTMGDAFCAAFASAKEAVAAAGEAQRALYAESWPDQANLRVRMALHTGECEERGGGYFGPAVNRTARLEATAHGGQVVVSRSTADVVRDRLPTGMKMVELGSYLLKDLERPEEVFQLDVDGVSAEFPPLRAKVDAEITTTLANPTNLTQSVSSFVGRDTEVAEVVKLLGNHRLVTLTGSGGVGKTRLAMEVGRAVLPDRSDGVWLSELAAVTDSGLVASEVLSDLGIGERSGQEALDRLVEVLSTQGRLVILDNCEQVLDGCAALADSVVRNCPEIRLLSTSREPLRIEGEVIYRVPSLSLPPEQVDDRTDLAGSGAVALFIERASAQAHGFELTDDDAPLVAAICRRLDGMPLALELATARLRSMSLAKLHDRLERRFGLLTGGSRVALPRQQTLQALVDWSFDLLTGPERALFRRTSMFVDGFDLEAAEGVCALDDIPDRDIADLLASLVDKSLVVAEPHGDDVRYRLQESLRQYGAERLAEVGPVDRDVNEIKRVVATHADYYIACAEQGAAHLAGRSSLEWAGRLDDEQLNLRSAIEHHLATPEGADRVLGQFWSLHRYWASARQPAQTLDLLEQALVKFGPDITPARRGQALCCKSMLLYQVDRRLALDAITATVGVAGQADDPALEAVVLSLYCRYLAFNGRDRESLEPGDKAMALVRDIGDPLLLSEVLIQFGLALSQVGDTRAETILLEALELVEQSGDVLTAAKLYNNYSTILIARGDFTSARSYLEAALKLSGSETGIMLDNLGWVLLQESQSERAGSCFTDSLRWTRLRGRLGDIPYPVLGIACCATHRGEFETAAVLHGGADALLSQCSVTWEALEATIRYQDIVVLSERLGDDFERLYAEGLTMPHGDVIKLALSGN